LNQLLYGETGNKVEEILGEDIVFVLRALLVAAVRGPAVRGQPVHFRMLAQFLERSNRKADRKFSFPGSQALKNRNRRMKAPRSGGWLRFGVTSAQRELIRLGLKPEIQFKSRFFNPESGARQDTRR
jgi:hypothetical protein